MSAAPRALSVVEWFSLALVFAAAAAFVGNALVQLGMGKPPWCVPEVNEALLWTVKIGAVLLVAGGLLGGVLAITGKGAPPLGRYGALAGAIVIVGLLSTDAVGDPIRRLFGMSSHGPLCTRVGQPTPYV